MKITFYGHACFGIETMGKHILFDPFISGNPKAAHIDVDSIPADYILISHGHADHLADAESIAKRTGATIISNYEIVQWYLAKELKAYPLNHGGKKAFDFGEVKYVNAIHSSVLPDGTYGGNPGGFLIHNEESSFYFSGDTALSMDMKLIPMTWPALDFSIFPIGDNFTMGHEDAIIACDFVDCNKVIACHFDTFGFIEIDHEKVKEAFKNKDKELILINIGDTLTI